MNVLHLHLSDYAAVRIEVPEYPALVEGLNNQYYSTADAAALVTYANERGVRIVPEVRAAWRLCLLDGSSCDPPPPPPPLLLSLSLSSTYRLICLAMPLAFSR